MIADRIASIVAIVAALILAARGLKARPVTPGRRLLMVVAWTVIIIGTVFIIRQFTGSAVS